MRTPILLFALSFLPLAPAFGQDVSQTLAIGEQRSFPIPPGTRYSLGNPEVIQAKSTQAGASGTLLLVIGKSQGYSDLVLLDEKGQIRKLAFRVVSKRQAAMAGDGNARFSSSPGLVVKPSGDGWIAKGKARSLEDWNIVKTLEAQAKGKLRSFSHLHPLERLKAESRILRLFRAAGLHHLKVRGAGDSLVLKGNCRDPEEKKLAEELAGQVIQNFRSQLRIPFEGGGRLRFRARILEVLRSEAQALGLDWQQGIPGAVLLGKKFSRLNFSLEAALKAMEKKGQARLLSQPQILLNEKGVAELKVGGEIPIPTKSRYSSNVIWKPYGLLLRLELPGMSEDLARAKIIVEISSLDPGNGAEGIPGMRVSRMETMVDLTIGKPVLLSGLMEKRQSRSDSLIPLLGDIPILGELFRSRDFQENRSELVIVLQAEEVGV